MSKHTPGPWETLNFPREDGVILQKDIPIFIDVGGRPIFLAHLPVMSVALEGMDCLDVDTQLANARLMVKSPEMYTVLKETKEAFHRQGTLRDCDISKIIDVLAEIEGES